MICSCPIPTEIGDLTALTCIENIGTVGKLAFQRFRDSSGTSLALNNSTIAVDNPNVLATWTSAKALSTDAKVTVLPTYVHNVEWGGGDARQYGGGDETFAGAPVILGEEFMTMSADLIQVPQSLIQELKAYRCESNLGVYLIMDNGNIVGIVDDLSSPTVFKPIPINGLHISSKVPGKRSAPDMNKLSFQVLEDWSDYLHVVTPSDFEALIEL